MRRPQAEDVFVKSRLARRIRQILLDARSAERGWNVGEEGLATRSERELPRIAEVANRGLRSASLRSAASIANGCARRRDTARESAPHCRRRSGAGPWARSPSPSTGSHAASGGSRLTDAQDAGGRCLCDKSPRPAHPPDTPGCPFG